MKRTIENIIAVAEQHGWNVTDEGANNYNFAKHSPLGRDFSFCAQGETAEELYMDIFDYYESYDCSLETYLQLDKKGHGINGAPYDMIDVYNDCEACETMVDDLLYSIQDE